MNDLEKIQFIINEIKLFQNKIDNLEKQKIKILQNIFKKQKSKITKYSPYKNKKNSDILLTKNDIECNNISDYEISSETEQSD